MLQLRDLISHYAVMIELDRTVHEDAELARQEIALALSLAGPAIHSVFLPCCGTGRHIQPLLDHGVERITAVDLSPECLAIAQERFANDLRVELAIGDLRARRGPATHDAVFLLGNSWGDFADDGGLRAMGAGILSALRPGGALVMDYIGGTLLDYTRQTSEWWTNFRGVEAIDRRTPRYDPETRVATIDIEVIASSPPHQCLWRGAYRKIVQSREELVQTFDGIRLEAIGRAEDLIPYHRSRGDLGMLARATWWVGRKEVIEMGR